MLRRLFCAALAVLALVTAAPGMTLYAAGDGDLQVIAIPDAQGSAVGAKAAIVMEAMTGRILFAQNIDDKLPVASTTKIMTALLTLEQPDLYQVFEVDGEAIKVEGSSMGLVEGDKATLRALATGMLLASGNDGAGAAAVRISGSTTAFGRHEPAGHGVGYGEHLLRDPLGPGR